VPFTARASIEARNEPQHRVERGLLGQEPTITTSDNHDRATKTITPRKLM
jgi:hypothetical protein